MVALLSLVVLMSFFLCSYRIGSFGLGAYKGKIVRKARSNESIGFSLEGRPCVCGEGIGLQTTVPGLDFLKGDGKEGVIYASNRGASGPILNEYEFLL